MQTITRHGGGSHYVRPDRVYRTGVLTSVMGYQPGPDVQAVAAAFTQYPMDLRVTDDGLSGPRLAGFFVNLRSKWQALRARAKRRMGLHGLRGDNAPGMTYMQVGTQIAPQLWNQAQMVDFLQQNGMTTDVAASMAATEQAQWAAKRWGR